MSAEHTQNDILDIVVEARKANEAARSGLYSVFTQENFPELAKEDPKTLALFKIEALNKRFNNLSTIRSIVSSDSEAADGISAELDHLRKESISVAKEYYPLESSTDEKLPASFYLSNNEDVTLRAILDLGLVDALNEDNIPSLSGLSDRDKLRLKMRVVTNAIEFTKTQINRSKKGVSMTDSGEEGLPKTYLILAGTLDELVHLSEEYSLEYLENTQES